METFIQQDKTIHLLLVEDDNIDAVGIERAFHKARIANPIHRAKDGVEALAQLRGTGDYIPLPTPYLLLVDLNMPRMGGIEFITELRADPKLKSSIVFVMTTSKQEEDLVNAYNLNVAGYIVKSNAGNDFVRLIDMIDHFWRVVEMP